MSIITIKKIIATIIVAILLVTITMPVFGATNYSRSISNIRSLFKKATKTMISILEIFSETVYGKKTEDPVEQPVVSTKTFAQIAKECKKTLRTNGFKYGTISYNYQTNPPSSSTSNKKIDCSGYVSWVIYEYAKQKGKTTLQSDFKNNKSSTEIKNYMDNNSTYFTKVGKLTDLTSSQLKAGDIIVKSGHIEIFGKYDSNMDNEYRCYNAGNDDALSSGANSGELTGGACNKNSSSYTVYRIK